MEKSELEEIKENLGFKKTFIDRFNDQLRNPESIIYRKIMFGIAVRDRKGNVLRIIPGIRQLTVRAGFYSKGKRMN